MFDVTIHTHLFLEQNILLLIHYVVSCQSLDVIFYTHVYGTILFLPMHCILSQFIHSFMAQYSFCRYIMSYLINSLRSNFIQLMAQCHFCKYINFCHILPTVRDFIHILQQIYSISADTFCQVLSIVWCHILYTSSWHNIICWYIIILLLYLVNCSTSHFINTFRDRNKEKFLHVRRTCDHVRLTCPPIFSHVHKIMHRSTQNYKFCKTGTILNYFKIQQIVGRCCFM